MVRLIIFFFIYCTHLCIYACSWSFRDSIAIHLSPSAACKKSVSLRAAFLMLQHVLHKRKLASLLVRSDVGQERVTSVWRIAIKTRIHAYMHINFNRYLCVYFDLLHAPTKNLVGYRLHGMYGMCCHWQGFFQFPLCLCFFLNGPRSRPTLK